MKTFTFFRGVIFFSIKGFLVRAVFLLLLYLFFSFIGLREYVSIISGTFPSGIVNHLPDRFYAVIYLLAWFGFYGGVPILLIAAFVFGIIEKLFFALKKGRID